MRVVILSLFSSEDVAGPGRTRGQVVKAANAPCWFSELEIFEGFTGTEALVLVMVSMLTVARAVMRLAALGQSMPYGPPQPGTGGQKSH